MGPGLLCVTPGLPAPQPPLAPPLLTQFLSPEQGVSLAELQGGWAVAAGSPGAGLLLLRDRPSLALVWGPALWGSGWI